MTQRAGERRTSGLARTWEWAKSVAVALVIWYVLTAVFVQAFRIPSGSMEGTLLIGDFLFANKALYGAEIPLINRRLPAIREPARQDIVIFDSVEEKGVHVVKRVIGMPGDTLAMVDNLVFVNGHVLDEPYRVLEGGTRDPSDPKMRWQAGYLTDGVDRRHYRPTLRNWGPLTVPPDSFFVMGDNRDRSYDSRYWGFLGRDRIRGHPILVYYSYDKESTLPFRLITGIRWSRLLSRPR